MAQDPQDFLSRWSRRKQDAPAQAKAPKKGDPAPALPSLDSLNFESDFKAFMHAKVEESVKRAALKKLFADPRFNVIDPMDIDIDDYTNLEAIPQEMLAKLQHARTTLFGREENKVEKAEAPSAPEEPKQEVAQASGQQPQKKSDEEADDGAAG